MKGKTIMKTKEAQKKQCVNTTTQKRESRLILELN